VSHREKLDRAKVHTDELEASVDAFLRSKPYRIVGEKDVQAWEYVQRVYLNVPFPSSWPLLIGDALHNMRCGLDHIVYSIAVKAGPVGDTEKIQFPIFRTEAGFHSKRARQFIRLLPTAAKDAVESLQPYQGLYGDDGSYTHPLWHLQRLNSVDKHRHFIIHGTRPPSMSVRIISGIVPNSWPVAFGVGGPMPDGAEILRAKMIPGFEGEPEVKTHITPSIGIGDPSLGANIFLLETLEDIENHIRDVVFPKLEPFL